LLIDYSNYRSDNETPVVIPRLALDIFYLCAKFDNSSFSRFRDIIGGAKFKMGPVTITTPLLRVICHPYAET